MLLLLWLAACDPIGTAHPTVFVAAAPTASWTILCQARADTDGDGAIKLSFGYHGESRGDALRMYLVRGSGTGEAIDGYVTHAGDRLVVIDRGRLVLLDGKARVDLGEASKQAVTTTAFSDSALAFVRDGKLIVRTLTTGEERSATVSNLVSVRFDSSGTLIHLTQASSLPRTTLADRQCRGPVMSYSTYGTGEAPTYSWISAQTLSKVDAWAPLPDGHRCVMTHVDGKRGVRLEVCAKEGDSWGELYWRDAKETKALGAKAAMPRADVWTREAGRYLRLTLDDSDAILDLDTRALWRAPDALFGVFGDVALVQKGAQLSLRQLSDGKTSPIAGDAPVFERFSPRLRPTSNSAVSVRGLQTPFDHAGSFVLLNGMGDGPIVDLAQRRTYAAPSRLTQALASDGRRLVAGDDGSLCWEALPK